MDNRVIDDVWYKKLHYLLSIPPSPPPPSSSFHHDAKEKGKMDSPLIDAYHEDLLPELRVLIRNELSMRERYVARRTCRRWYAEDEAISLSDGMARIIQEWDRAEWSIPHDLFLAIVEASGMKWNPIRFSQESLIEPPTYFKMIKYFKLVWTAPCCVITGVEHELRLSARFELLVIPWLIKEWTLDATECQFGCVTKVAEKTCTSLAELLAPTQAAWFLGTSTSWCEVRGFIDPFFHFLVSP